MSRDNNSSHTDSTPADELYYTIFDVMAEGVVVQSAEGTVIKANPAALQILGLSKQQLYGVSSVQPVLPTLREDGSELPGLEHPAMVTLHTGKPISGFVMGVVRNDGALVWLSVNARLITHSGDQRGVVTTFSDITPLKTAEARLRESEANVRNILQTAPIGMAIVALTGEFLQVNRALCELSGYSREELLNSNFRDFTHIEDDWDKHAANVQRLFTGEVSSYQMERQNFRKDGRLVWISFTVSLLRDDHGTPLHFIVQVKNIDDRKLALETMQATRRQLRMLIDTLPALVAMIDRDGYCVIANVRYGEALGVPLDRIEGHHYHSIVPAEYLAMHTEMLQRCLSGESVEFMEQYLRSGSNAMYLQGRYVPLYENGAVNGAVVAVTDVSELKRAQLQLTRLNGDLLAKVAEIHQLQMKLHDLAIRDALTGLHNRRFLDEQLPRELARARRLQQPLCIALGDIDYFKTLNDTYGHQAGDAVLRSLRDFFATVVRETDLVCRWGGEEILIVMPGLEPQVALQRLNVLRAALARETIVFGPHQLRITISFGIAAYCEGISSDELIHRADIALYEAKAAGRDCCHLYRPL